MGLSFRVRNGTGRFPHAMTAVTLAPAPRVGGGEIFGGYNFPAPRIGGSVVLLFSCVPLEQANRFGLLFGNHIVDASALVIF